MMTSRVLAGAVLALVAAAPAATAQETVRLPERDRVLRGDAPVVWSVGQAEGRDWEMLSSVRSMAFDRDDNLHVLDRGNGRVLVFDAAGRFVRQIGRQGNGPGELIAPMQVHVAADGTVVVTDLGRRALSLFAPDGAFLRNVEFGGNWMLGMGAGGYHPRGGMVFMANPGPPAMMRPGESLPPTEHLPIVYLPLAGGAATPIYNVPRHIPGARVESSGGNRVMIRAAGPPTFAPPVLLGVLPDGHLAVGFTPLYTIRILDAAGRPVRYLQRPTRVRQTTEADRERARETRRRQFASGDMVTVAIGGGGGGAMPRISSEMVEQQIEQMRFADTIPALKSLLVAPSGKLWVERTPEIVHDDGPIDLLTPAGEYLGTLTSLSMPRAISRGGLAAWVERDDMDVERVVVRRLPAEWR